MAHFLLQHSIRLHMIKLGQLPSPHIIHHLRHLDTHPMACLKCTPLHLQHLPPTLHMPVKVLK